MPLLTTNVYLMFMIITLYVYTDIYILYICTYIYMHTLYICEPIWLSLENFLQQSGYRHGMADVLKKKATKNNKVLDTSLLYLSWS